MYGFDLSTKNNPGIDWNDDKTAELLGAYSLEKIAVPQMPVLNLTNPHEYDFNIAIAPRKQNNGNVNANTGGIFALKEKKYGVSYGFTSNKFTYDLRQSLEEVDMETEIALETQQPINHHSNAHIVRAEYERMVCSFRSWNLDSNLRSCMKRGDGNGKRKGVCIDLERNGIRQIPGRFEY